MKLAVVGIGQCGSRVADHFARLNKLAKNYRGFEIVTGAIAVNSNEAEMSGLSTIKADFHHRIIIGRKETHGHGAAMISELGAHIAKEDGDMIIDSLRSVQHMGDNDAFLVVAATSGGTGAGGLPVVVRMLKDRYATKPVYAMAVLPYDHEIAVEKRAAYNTAVCLKTVYPEADAVFLIDNQRYIGKDYSIQSNIHKINELIVMPFYNLLCAGEERNPKYVGGRMLDAGDIKETLGGWTAIGYGKTQLPLFRLHLDGGHDFRQQSGKSLRGIQAMDEALSQPSVFCRVQDAHRALYCISGPSSEMSIDLIKELSDFIKARAPGASLRYGDYPREKSLLDIVVVLSDLSKVERVRQLFARAVSNGFISNGVPSIQTNGACKDEPPFE